MGYFNNFPVLNYSLSSTELKSKVCRDILVSTKFFDIVSNAEKRANIFVDHIIKDGEKPEHIAYKAYGSSELHWIILLSNQIINPYYDWPLSTRDLDSYIDSHYPGMALFVPCVDPNTSKLEIHFTVKDSIAKLSHEKSHFVIGETVTQGNEEATVFSWDSILRKVVLVDGTIDFNTTDNIISTNEDGVEFQVTPIRKIIYNKESIHHFRDNFGNVIDPYGQIDPTSAIIYSTKNIIAETDITVSATNNFPLNMYLNNNAVLSTLNVVTNQQYETELNDSKRNIKILKPEYVDTIVSDLSQIFNK